MGTGGSNPPFSAKIEDDDESSFFSGYGAVRLAHLLWEQGVEGSNPFAPTENQGVTSDCDSFFFAFSEIRTQKGHAFSKHLLSLSYTFTSS